MSIIKDDLENILNVRITKANPTNESLIVQNKLLSGKIHIQSIGSPVKKYTIDFTTDADTQKIIAEKYSYAQFLYFIISETTYQCLISTEPSWDMIQISPFCYKGTMELSIIEEVGT